MVRENCFPASIQAEASFDLSAKTCHTFRSLLREATALNLGKICCGSDELLGAIRPETYIVRYYAG